MLSKQKEKTTTQNYKFGFYNEKLTRLHKNFNAANIIAEVTVKENTKQISIYEYTPYKQKTKICDVFQNEITKYINEKIYYIAPEKINTLTALKKAVIFNILS